MDVHQIITLGIGTPGDIPHFVLFGLSPNPNPVQPEVSTQSFISYRSDDTIASFRTPDTLVSWSDA